jgi:hypothetical protein
VSASAIRCDALFQEARYCTLTARTGAERTPVSAGLFGATELERSELEPRHHIQDRPVLRMTASGAASLRHAPIRHSSERLDMHNHIGDRRNVVHDPIFDGMGNFVSAADGCIVINLYVDLSDMFDPHSPHP